jgi:hypothetical protein
MGIETEYKAIMPFGRQSVMDKIDSLAEFQGPSYRYEIYKDRMGSNAVDRDGKVIKNGQVKYFRHYWSGRLMRGEAIYNINNMWWVVMNETSATNIAAYELFDPTPEDFKHRKIVRDRASPENRVRRKIGTKLYNELRAKGISMTEEAADAL